MAIRGDTVFVTVTGSEESFVARNADATRVAELRALGAGARVRVEGDFGEATDAPGETTGRLRIRSVESR